MRCNKVLLAVLSVTLLTAVSAAAEPFAYVLTDGGAYYRVVDLATNTEVESIRINGGSEHYSNVVASPDGSFVYVADGIYSDLLVVSTATNTQTADIALPGYITIPKRMAITPDGKFLYISGSPEYEDYISPPSISVVSTSTYKVVASITTDKVQDLAVSPDGRFLYVANVDTFRPPTFSQILVISTGTNEVVNTIPLNPGMGQLSSASLSFSPDGTLLYVANAPYDPYGKNPKEFYNVAVISTGANKVVKYIDLPFYPENSAVSPDGKTLYVAGAGFNGTVLYHVALISTATNVVSRTIDLVQPIYDSNFNGFSSGVSFTKDGKVAYVTLNGGVFVIDTATETQVEQIQLPANAISLVIAPPSPAFTTNRGGISFGLRPVGTTSVTVPLTVSTGQLPLTYSFALSGAAPQDFQTSHSCPSPLQAGQPCTLGVNFAPTAIGQRTATLTINGAGANNGVPYSVSRNIPLAGTAIAAFPAGPLAFSPTVVMYSPHPVFTSSGVAKISASNVSGSAATIASVTVAGENPQDFNIVSNGCVGVLIPGHSCAIQVVFKPTKLETRTGTIQYTINGQAQPQEVLVTGTGTQ